MTALAGTAVAWNRRPKNRNAPYHWVYVLEDIDSIHAPSFKVGITTISPERRAEQEEQRFKRDGEPLNAIVVKGWQFKNCDLAHAFEGWFLYALRRLQYVETYFIGNWFTINADDMTTIVERFDAVAKSIIAVEDGVRIKNLAEALALEPTRIERFGADGEMWYEHRYQRKGVLG